MISGYGCYVKFLSIKSHFQNEKYDYFKYHGAVRASEEAFKKRNDRYFFEKLAKKLKDPEIVERYVVANLIENSNIWIGDVLDSGSNDVYLNWKNRLESLSYKLQQDMDTILDRVNGEPERISHLFQVVDGKYPIALQMMLGDYISKETILILNITAFNFLKTWDEQITDKVVFPELYKKLTKYQVFFKKYITKEQMTNFKQIILKKIS